LKSAFKLEMAPASGLLASVKWLKFGVSSENIENQPLRNVLMPSQILPLSIITLAKEKTRYHLSVSR